MKRSSALLLAALLVPLAGCEWFRTINDPASIEPHERQPLLAPQHAVPLNGMPEYDLTNADQRLSNPEPSSPHSLETGRAFSTVLRRVYGRTGRGAGRGPALPGDPAVAPRRSGSNDPYIFG